jgi:hypothetical protein
MGITLDKVALEHVFSETFASPENSHPLFAPLSSGAVTMGPLVAWVLSGLSLALAEAYSLWLLRKWCQDQHIILLNYNVVIQNRRGVHIGFL